VKEKEFGDSNGFKPLVNILFFQPIQIRKKSHMSFSDLASAICNTEFRIDQYRKQLKKSLDSNVLLEISDMYRCIGCGSYLMDLNKQEFADNLYYSGSAYQFLLENVTAGALPAHLGWRSKGNAWLDIVAINAVDLAIKIAPLMSNTCHDADGELEEDFLYYSLIEGIFLNSLNDAQQQQLVSQFEQASNGGDSLRFQAVNALISVDADGFEQALLDMIEQWAGNNKREFQADRLNPYYFHSTGKICIEGLALVKLASSRGIIIDTDMAFIPRDLINFQPYALPTQFKLVEV
jgi:hypothetical protein